MATTYEIINGATGHVEQLAEGKAQADKIVAELNEAGTFHDGERVTYSARKVEPAPKRKAKG